MPRYLLLAVMLAPLLSPAQVPALYSGLPVGKYPVGFRIISLTDSNRFSKPEYNYLGEKNEGDRRKKVTIHIWYPARSATSARFITYGEYCYNQLLSHVNDEIPAEQKVVQQRARRNSVDGWFGKPSDEAWQKLLNTSMLAKADAEPTKEKFPLLIGMLRPLSTTISNEVMASNGYVVAMIKVEPGPISSQPALQDIPDMQFAMTYLSGKENVDVNKIGAYGFSGSGFSQVLLSMYEYRIKALADIESGLYMNNLFQALSGSNYYNPSRLRVPFLHIFSLDLSKEEKYIDEFERKTKFSKRYRLLLNQPKLHHWDFAAEGYTSCRVLQNRGEAQNNIARSFEIATLYLLHFFNAELKDDKASASFLSAKPVLPSAASTLWDITTFDPVSPAPTRDEFEQIIRTKGIGKALSVVSATIGKDSSTNILQWPTLNNLGYTFLNEKKYKEAIAVFKLNTEWHPDDANLFDSLTEAYETAGDKENMRKMAQKVLDLLSKKTTLAANEVELKRLAEERLKM